MISPEQLAEIEARANLFAQPTRKRHRLRRDKGGPAMSKPRKQEKPACWGCECGVKLVGDWHEEEGVIDGLVYVYPCKRNLWNES